MEQVTALAVTILLFIYLWFWGGTKWLLVPALDDKLW
jgi:hypothetical protein